MTLPDPQRPDQPASSTANSNTATHPCTRCGRPAILAVDASGVCPRCAGAGVLALTLADRPGSTPPIALVESHSGPTRIGPYTIISELGRGGMGTVYLAQHTQLGRIVALKVIASSGAATSDLEMRFLREARTIARLSHPHIVAVHDAGRDRGHAYFSMDYFEDGDLSRRLRAQPFSPRDAAQLLHSVAAAVAFSHAAGVLHRDLKPSNILLADGIPHVADFGLASELDSSGGLTARTAVLGTPHYLAPEALSHGSAAQGVPSDIFSLGVILHEMLTGRTPFAGASPAQLPGLLARGDAPDLRLLAPQVPPDLATICAKCLEYDPTRRYATAADLTEDLRRFLAGEPIAARPVSAASRLLRWTRRRPALAATWLLSLALALGSLTAAALLNRERLRADDAAAASGALADFFGQDFLNQASLAESPDRDLKLRIALDRAIARIPQRFARAPVAEASIRFTVGLTYQSLGEFPEAERHFRRSAALRRLHLGPDHEETLRAMVELAAALTELGRNADADALLQTASATLARTVGPDHPLAITALATASLVTRRLGRMPAAEVLARRALATARRALGPDHELTRRTLVDHAALLSLLGRLEEALIPAREAVATTARVLGSLHSATLVGRVKLAAIEVELGRAAAAESTLREIYPLLLHQFGPDHPEVHRALSHLGNALFNLGKYAEADTLLTQLVADCRRARGPEHGATLLAMKRLALARARTHRIDDALALMREASEISARINGPTHITTLNYVKTLASLFVAARRYEDALVPARTAYETALRAHGPDSPSTRADADVFVTTLGLVNRHPEAVAIRRELANSLALLQPNHWGTQLARGQLGLALALAGELAEAETLLRESYPAVLAQRAEFPISRRGLPELVAAQLAAICTARGRPAEAAEWQAKATSPKSSTP